MKFSNFDCFCRKKSVNNVCKLLQLSPDLLAGLCTVLLDHTGGLPFSRPLGCNPQMKILVLPLLQYVQNALAHAVVAALRSSNPDHILKSLYWLRVQECIEYNVISIMYKLLQSSSAHYLCDFNTFQPSQSN